MLPGGRGLASMHRLLRLGEVLLNEARGHELS
jgi:hypothetical protein